MGHIDAAEFGFSSRMLGFHDVVYDIRREVLDSERVYVELDELAKTGALKTSEVIALNRYRFMGTNYFPSEAKWEKLLHSTGFNNANTIPPGEKLWHGYYPVQWFTHKEK